MPAHRRYVHGLTSGPSPCKLPPSLHPSRDSGHWSTLGSHHPYIPSTVTAAAVIIIMVARHRAEQGAGKATQGGRRTRQERDKATTPYARGSRFIIIAMVWCILFGGLRHSSTFRPEQPLMRGGGKLRRVTLGDTTNEHHHTGALPRTYLLMDQYQQRYTRYVHGTLEIMLATATATAVAVAPATSSNSSNNLQQQQHPTPSLLFHASRTPV